MLSCRFMSGTVMGLGPTITNSCGKGSSDLIWSACVCVLGRGAQGKYHLIHNVRVALAKREQQQP